ncbi:fungal-specific transcription factor domain-containing protein [Chaetomium sp. MPI-CAGE-AT-0009]|nr:fungal-specific transcription factor domain-containing protein [Chaetomium sp. MPI-CAGE-AT-0009]
MLDMGRNKPSQPTGQNVVHKVGRLRAARACDLCRTKKNKCDELYPCTYCKDRNAECIYRGQRCFMPDYVKHLEDLVQQLSASATRAQGHPEDTGDSSSGWQGTVESLNDKETHNAEVPRTTFDIDRNIPAAGGEPRHGGGHEVSGVNRHTHSVEFYGKSSSVALLSQVQRSGEGSAFPAEQSIDPSTIVSSLHNPAFSPASQGDDQPAASFPAPSHYRQCRSFLDQFLSSIHYVHPIVDKAAFLRRCELLWGGSGETIQDASFTALYYSILSLGALVGVRDDEPIDGIENLQWSRKFFNEARRRCNKLGIATDLNMVQCYFFMAKVCQNELNAHWSYMYIGLAVRTALAMGINRAPPPDTKKDQAQLGAESRTWWGLYSLETEISFAMGRPDTLGADSYHNQHFPFVPSLESASPTTPGSSDNFDPPYCAIIKPMVDFSRITRKVCHGIYLRNNTTPKTVGLADQIEQELDEWVNSLPSLIRPQPKSVGKPESLRAAKEAKWVKRQRLVLLIRYFNLRILLFGSVLLTSTPAERASIPGSIGATEKCLEAARQTIQVIYQVLQHQDFFHTWFYNTTYTVFAASMILVYITQEATKSELPPLFEVVNMAVEILEAMSESVVATKAAVILRRASDSAEKKAWSTGTTMTTNQSAGLSSHGQETMLHLNQYWGPLNLVGSEMDLDLSFFQFADWNGENPSMAMGEDEL